MEEKLDGI